jgi:hypothetical protein
MYMGSALGGQKLYILYKRENPRQNCQIRPCSRDMGILSAACGLGFRFIFKVKSIVFYSLDSDSPYLPH